MTRDYAGMRKATALREVGNLLEARAVALSALDKEPLHTGLGDLVCELDDALLRQQIRELEQENERENEKESKKENLRES